MSTNTAIGVFEPVSLIVLLRFKTATVQFRQESYGAYGPRPAAQLRSLTLMVINRRPGSPDCSGDAYTLTVHSKSKSKAVYDK